MGAVVVNVRYDNGDVQHKVAVVRGSHLFSSRTRKVHPAKLQRSHVLDVCADAKRPSVSGRDRQVSGPRFEPPTDIGRPTYPTSVL